MSISTATELKTALENWSKRPDLSTRLDEFIALFEAKANRVLRVNAMETAMSSTALTDGAITNPTGFMAWKELRYDGSLSWTLEPRPLEWIRAQPDLATFPIYFAVANTQTICWPQSGNVEGTYYKAIPSLTANSANWLLTSHPDLYLSGCLEQLFEYTNNQARLGMYAAKTSFLLEQLQGSDNANRLNGGPLTARPR